MGEAGSGSCATAGSACAAAACLDSRTAARRPAMRHRVERVIAPGVSEPTRFLVMKEPLGGTRCAGGPGTQSSQTGRASSCPGHSPRSRRREPPAHPWGAPKRGWDWGESASQSSCPFPDPPHCRDGDAAVERQWDSTGERGDLPQVKHQVHQGCQSLPEDQAETGENVRARGCSEQSLKAGIWGKEIPIIPPLLLRTSSFPPAQPWAAHGGTWEGATGKDRRGSVPHQNPQPRSSGARPSSSQPGSGAPETAREVPGAAWASAAHRLQQALSKETQSGAGPRPGRRGAERHSPAGPALLCFALLKNRTI